MPNSKKRSATDERTVVMYIDGYEIRITVKKAHSKKSKRPNKSLSIDEIVESISAEDIPDVSDMLIDEANYAKKFGNEGWVTFKVTPSHTPIEP